MEKYKIFGSEMSPYSVKVRAYLRFKQIPYEWILRSKENRIEFDKLARFLLSLLWFLHLERFCKTLLLL